MAKFKTISLPYKPMVVFFSNDDEITRQKLIKMLGIFIEADEDKFDEILAKYSQDPREYSPLYCGAVAGEIELELPDD
jgi:hypothetical protein